MLACFLRIKLQTLKCGSTGVFLQIPSLTSFPIPPSPLPSSVPPFPFSRQNLSETVGGADLISEPGQWASASHVLGSEGQLMLQLGPLLLELGRLSQAIRMGASPVRGVKGWKDF